MRFRLACLIAILVFTTGANLRSAAVPAQCRAPLPPASTAANIFSAEQERDLGDAVAERFEGNLRLIEDESLTLPLRQIGERLAAHLPQTGLQVKLHLIDLAEANAFALPGGRIYVTRKLVGLTRREDELAAVIGHELGHLITRQQTISTTKQLRELLGVTSLGDRNDVVAKYNQLMENAGRKPGLFNNDDRETADQLEADRVGLFVVAAAGYDPRAHATLYDRFTRAEGNTGSFFSKLFGTTSPDSRRLAELVKTAAALPADCTPPASPSPTAYLDWQRRIALASAASREERLPGLVKQTPLTPFRDRVSHVRFSPNGAFVLVQDDSSVFVLDRQPFALRFRIDARRARSAEFSQDSTLVTLHTADLRVERWSVATKSLDEVYDVHWPQPCLTSAAAPDGRTIACVDLSGHLTVLDAVSGRQVFQKKAFYQASGVELLLTVLTRATNFRTSGFLTMEFSPSSQYLAAGYTSYSGSGVLLYDVAARAQIQPKSAATKILGGTFAFLGGDRILGFNPADPRKSGVVKLPEGAVAEEFQLPVASLDRVSQSKYVLMKPVSPYPVGIFDLQSKQVKAGFDALAVDVYEDHYVTDSGAGDVALFAVEGKKLVSRVTLPASPMVSVRTAAVSPDFRWLAMSGDTRGAIWDTTRPQGMAYMRDFDGSSIDDAGMLYADFPKAGAEPRTLMQFDAAQRRVVRGQWIVSLFARQYGQWLVERRSLSGNPYGVTGPVEYSVRNVRNATPAWIRKFERDSPNDYWMDPEGDALALVWAADSPGGRIMVARDERLKKTVNRGDVKGDFALEIVDAATGNVRSRVLVETGKGSFHIDGVLVRGDRMFVSDSLGRVLNYSLATGEVTGYAVGDTPTVSADGRLLALKTGEGRLAVYEVATMTRRADLRFKHEVVFGTFSRDGGNLLALTADQTVHLIGTGSK